MSIKIDQYRREVKWNEEDGCYVGRCPDLFLGGCHGEDANAVDGELREIVAEVIAEYRSSGRELPEPSRREPRLNTAVAARRRSGLNQKSFARALGIGTGTVRNWEQGRIRPKGTAATLLKIIERHPELLMEIAGG